MSTYRFTIPGRLPDLNEYVLAERSHRIKGAKMKAESERLIRACIRKQLGKIKLKPPVFFDYLFIEKDRRRDKSNISAYARKVIEDSVVKEGLLPNDGWKEIDDYHDSFAVDKDNPRIEMTLIEVENDSKRSAAARA